MAHFKLLFWMEWFIEEGNGLFFNILKLLKTYATFIDLLSAGQYCYLKSKTYLLLLECLHGCKPFFVVC
jgi:hypothetical protein